MGSGSCWQQSSCCWSIWSCRQALETLSTSCLQVCETKRNAGPRPCSNLVTGKRNSEAHGVPVPVGCASGGGRAPHRAPVQDSAPLAPVRIPTGSRASSSAWSGPSTAKLSCPRGTWSVVTEAPLCTHNHTLRRVTESETRPHTLPTPHRRHSHEGGNWFEYHCSWQART